MVSESAVVVLAGVRSVDSYWKPFLAVTLAVQTICNAGAASEDVSRAWCALDWMDFLLLGSDMRKRLRVLGQVIMGKDGTDAGARKLEALQTNANCVRARLTKMGFSTHGSYDSPVVVRVPSQLIASDDFDTST